jgi:cytidine deaminase
MPASSETSGGGGGSDLDSLIAEAWRARERAYAPYSGFLVGAALATDIGVVTGANVENASYGLSICAERVACATGVAAGAKRIDAAAVVSSARLPAGPCGACRQFLYEFNPAMTVVSEGTNGERKEWTLSELLVDGFGRENLDSAR